MFKNFFINFIKYFPSSKNKWKSFIFTTFPIIISSIIFSLNGVIDNFMSVSIEGGVSQLSYANTWTSIANGILTTSVIVGATIFGQYYGAKDQKNITYTLRARVLFSLVPTFLMAIPAFIAPREYINLAAAFNKIDENTMNESSIYLRIIAITWITNVWSLTTTSVMRESGNLKAALFSSLLSTGSNIILNAAFLFGIEQSVFWLAISTVISQIFLISFNTIFILLKNRSIIINPLKIFDISKDILKQFFKRLPSFFLLAIGAITVSIRYIFWNKAFPEGSIGPEEYLLNAAVFLGIANAIFNVFWSSFESINTNATIFIARNLGAQKVEKAKENAKELLGFHLIMAFILCSLLFLMSLLIPNMKFIAVGYEKTLISSGLENEKINLAIDFYLENLKFTIWPLTYNMIVWAWFITRSRSFGAGGRTNIMAICNGTLSLFQTLWIFLLTFYIVPSNNLSLPSAYALFFVFDLVKIIVYELLIRNLEWARTITYEIKH